MNTLQLWICHVLARIQECSTILFWQQFWLQLLAVMVTQHIPTMTNSHHGGILSVMMMVGICQWQNPTIDDDDDDDWKL